MPRRTKTDWIDWRKSEAREVILDDLESGRLPLDADVVSAEEAWEEMYFPMPEFQNIMFSQFKARLKDHRKQVLRRKGSHEVFLEAFRHDMELRRQGFLPGERPYDQRGELMFVHSAAQPYLKQDVSDELHKNMTSEELHESRGEYMEWPLYHFRRRLRQEISTQKYLYYLEWKRAQKQLKRGQKDKDQGEDSEEENNDEDGDDDDDDMEE